MSTRLIQLSVRAHEQAIERGTQTPAERHEFMNLRMKRLPDGTPVFDSARMRPDQIVDTIERLETMCGAVVKGTVRDTVASCLAGAGRGGVRVQDVCLDTGASKPIVLKYLRELIAAGHVIVKEEQTRGTGSKRKRYIWTADAEFRHAETVHVDGETLHVRGDSFLGQNDWSGIVYHGAAVDGLLCGCQACQTALEEAMEAEQRSAARRMGGTGLSVGLEMRRVRRERQKAADHALAVAHGLAASR